MPSKKESMQPSRNDHFLQLCFSRVCQRSQNLSTSRDVLRANKKRIAKDVVWRQEDRERVNLTNDLWVPVTSHNQAKIKSANTCSKVTVSRFGLAVRHYAGKQKDRGSISLSPFCTKIVVCGHCLVTLPLTVHENIKTVPSLCRIILVVTVQC